MGPLHVRSSSWKRTPGNWRLWLSVCIFAAGCADLKGVSSYAGKSASAITQPFPYGYSAYCYDSCYTYDTTQSVGHYPCDCAIANKYDTLVIREATRLSAYFAALARLAGSAEYINVGVLGAGIEAGTYGKLTITSTETSILNGVTTALQDLITAGYKSKHIQDNLHRYGDTVSLALGSYINHLAALNGQITDLTIYLKQQLIVYRAQTAATPGPQRWTMVYAYNEKIRDLNGRHSQFQKMIGDIRLVQTGYDDLARNADAIKSKEMKDRLMALVNNISFLSNPSKN